MSRVVSWLFGSARGLKTPSPSSVAPHIILADQHYTRCNILSVLPARTFAEWLKATIIE